MTTKHWFPTLLLPLTLLGLLIPGAVSSGTLEHQILVFTKTAGFRHGSIPEAIDAVDRLAKEHGFAADFTEDGADFNDGNLERYSAVVFLLTSGDVLDKAQQAAFERYIGQGGGYAGVHSASDTEYSWPWYGRLVGAYFDRHPAQQTATLAIENPVHASTRLLPSVWSRFDEWYDFQTNPRDSVSVLITVDEASYSGGGMGEDHPLAWYQEYGGGRSWYTALGHTDDSYSEPDFLNHLLGGIQYAAGIKGPLTVNDDGRHFIRANSGEPVYLAGVGGPEGFLYETDERKQQIVDALVQSGANTLYMHSIRSFEGDGYDFEDPFNINNDPTSGIAPGVFDNWMSFLSQLDEAGVVTWFHILDDTARPWGCEVPLNDDAVAYIDALVNTFKSLDNLVWLAGEEYLMGSCSTAQDNALMSAIAAEIAEHDLVHPIGVHHNNGQAMQFGDDPNVNVFAQQICGNSGTRNPDGIYDAAELGDWVYVMAECHPWHLNLLHDQDRTMLRLSNWATAMAGGSVLMYNAYECAHAGRLCSRDSSGQPASANDPHDPSPQMLGDLARLREFMESMDFTHLTPANDRAQADTKWVSTNPITQQIVLYASGSPQELGVAKLPAGTYQLRWFDPVSGGFITQIRQASDQPFVVPQGLSSEAAVLVSPEPNEIIFSDTFGD